MVSTTPGSMIARVPIGTLSTWVRPARAWVLHSSNIAEGSSSPSGWISVPTW